jgi:predicted DsbA family dithiol-disulfide isomerase
MTTAITIDFISDVSCPWCAVGLYSLETALARIGSAVPTGDAISPRLTFRPFELNPDMPPEGEDSIAHLARKYGASEQQLEHTRAAITQRGADVGFTFHLDKRTRIYNSFDAHRLLHWAGLEGKQRELAIALFTAYFTEGENPSDHEVLLRVASSVSLDQARTKAILASTEFADEVRQMEAWNQQNGIQAVPAVIINGKYLIQGGQPPEAFEQALRQIMAK